MKLFYMSLFSMLCHISYGQLSVSQDYPRSCPTTVQWHEEKMNTDYDYRTHIESYLTDRVQYMNEPRQTNAGCAQVLVVPVAVHYDAGIVPAGSEACVEDIVNQQLASLNADFASTNADVSNWSSYASCFDTSPGETCIQFCLATRNHPAGWGLNDGDPAITFGDVRFSWPADILGGDPLPANTDWAGYMNIFIQSGTGVLGISDGIPGNFSGTGVIVEACNFGGTDTGASVTCPGVDSGDSCGGIYDEGRTLTHEIGHYLGLFHIWGDNAGCTGAQDQVADTPNMNTSHLGSSTTCPTGAGCGSLPNTCTNDSTPAGGTDDYPDMPFNYMSYVSDNCMWMFTEGQATVMFSTVQSAGFTTSTDKCGEVSIRVTNSPQTVCLPASTAVFDVTVDLAATYTGTLTLSATGNPAGTTVAFSQNNISASTTLTMTVSGITAVGTDLITITGDDGSDTFTDVAELIVANTGAGAITQIAPVDGASDQIEPLVFTWNADANATEYEFQIASDAAFTNVIFSTNVAGTGISITGFATSTTYYWRVRALGDCGNGPYTSIWSFTMADSFPCTQYAGGPYAPFEALACFPDCSGAPITATFQVWANEAYITPALTAGVEYEFEFCAGYSAANWVANITVGQHDGAGGVLAGTVVAAVNGDCSAVFTAQADAQYIAIISTACGGAELQVNNGIPTLGCTGNIDLPTEVASANATYSATYEYEEGGWTHYLDGGADCRTLSDDILLLSVQKNGEDIGSVGTGAFDVSVFANDAASQILNNGNYVGSIGGDWYTMNRFWTLTPQPEPTNPVNVRFYYTDADFNAVNTALGGALLSHEEMEFWKINDIATTYNSDPTVGHVGVPQATVYDGDGFWKYISGTASTNSYAYSTFGPYHQVEFTVGHFGGGGGGALSIAVLPVELAHFTGEKVTAGNLMKWITSSETDNAFFELERSSSALSGFEVIAKLTGAGTSDRTIHYEWLDESPDLGTNYYRLKQVDFSGAAFYSDIIAIDYSPSSDVIMYPNPTEDEVRISFDSISRGEAQVDLYSVTGQLLRSWQFQVSPGRESLPLTLTNIPAGAYFVRIAAGEQVMIEKLVKK